MNTRSLLIFSVIIMVLAVAFYREQTNITPTQTVQSASNIEYQAEDILAVQTTDSGVAEYTLTARELTHYTDQNADELVDMTLNWRPNEGDAQQIRLTADTAVMDYDTQIVTMQNNVVFANRFLSPLNGANSAHPVDNQSPVHQSPLKLVAQTLIGDLEHKKLRSDEPVIVTQGEGDNQNEFKSASMQADLMTGDYDFRQVAVTFVPPKRQDTPLF